MSYVFSFTFFFIATHYHLALVAATFSYFVTAATKFSCCSSNKKMSPLFFISRSRSLSPFFSLSFAGLPPTFSFSLSFSCSIFQICGHDNESKLKTLDNTDAETISALNFRLYWLCLCFTRRWWLCDFPPLHLGCHTCWLRYFTVVCLLWGQTVARAAVVQSRVYQIFSDG